MRTTLLITMMLLPACDEYPHWRADAAGPSVDGSSNDLMVGDLMIGESVVGDSAVGDSAIGDSGTADAGPNPKGTITAHFSASRLSGVAPLAVFFDATTTTSTFAKKAFHELHYAWDFGDPKAGTWQYGNPKRKDRNKALGPVAAHVFEMPGTYTVKLTTTGLNGDIHG